MTFIDFSKLIKDVKEDKKYMTRLRTNHSKIKPSKPSPIRPVYTDMSS